MHNSHSNIAFRGIELLLPWQTIMYRCNLSDEFDLSPAERRVYEMVCQGDVMCKDVPRMDSGAIPSLISKGLVEVYKRRVSPFRDKRHKYLRRV